MQTWHSMLVYRRYAIIKITQVSYCHVTVTYYYVNDHCLDCKVSSIRLACLCSKYLYFNTNLYGGSKAQCINNNRFTKITFDILWENKIHCFVQDFFFKFYSTFIISFHTNMLDFIIVKNMR